MPSRYELLYKVFNGEEECVMFLEEGLADPSCTKTTYLVKTLDRKRMRVSKESYTDRKTAWRRYVDSTEEYLTNAQAEVQKAIEHLLYVSNELIKAKEKLLCLEMGKTFRELLNPKPKEGPGA